MHFSTRLKGDLITRSPFLMSHSPGSNWRPARYECAALPTELKWLGAAKIVKIAKTDYRVFKFLLASC